jgi:hypothetical protein
VLSTTVEACLAFSAPVERCSLPYQHQEKKGAFFWKRCVKVVLKFLNFSVVPTWPRDLEKIYINSVLSRDAPDNPSFFDIRYPAGYQIGQPEIRYGRIPDIRLMYSWSHDFLLFLKIRQNKI